VTASGSVVSGGWSPGAAVDGNTTSVATALGWTSNAFPSAANTAWIQLDLGTARTLDRVDLYPRNDAPNLGRCFPQAFTIAVSADGTTWTTVTTQSNYPQPTTPAPATFGFAPTSVRYVKVTGTTLRNDGSANYYMQFAEVAALNDRPDPTAGQRLTVRDPRSTSATDNTYLTSYTYDAIGNMTAVTTPPVPGFPAGRTSTVAYTDGTTVPAADTGFAPAGLPYRTTSPGGAVNTISYLRNGDVASTTDADGLATRYTYDALGRVVTKKLVSDTFPAGVVTTYGYDGESRVTSEVSPAVTNRVTGAVHTPHATTVFDADGNPTSQTVVDDTGGDASRTQSTTYNGFNQVATSTDALNRSTSYTYDAYGRKLTETDPKGTVTAYTYDANGNLLTKAINNFTGDPVNPSPAAKLTQESRAYDPANRLSSITDAMGRKTSYTYTDNGLLASVVRRDSAGLNPYTLKTDTYDAAGNLTKEVANNGGTTTNRTVDAAARPTSSTLDPTGVNRTTRISYTPDDAVATSTTSDATGATQVTSASYDPMGRVTSRSVMSDGAGHPVGWWRLNQTAGQTVVDASGTGNTAAANAGVTWSGGAATFNGTSGAVTTNGPVLNTAQSFSVSAWANVASTATVQTMVGQDGAHASGFNLQWNPATGKWAFAHNNSDTDGTATVRVESAAAATLNTWTHLVGTYDSATGAWKLYLNGALSGSTSITGPWNATGRLTIGRGQSNTAAGEFTNGSVGNVQVYQRALSATDVSTLYGAGRTSGTVASSNQLTTTWSLDQRGLPTSVTDPNGNVTTYNYDEAGHLVVTAAPTVNVEVGGGTATAVHPVTTRGYNTFGNQTEVQDPNGNTVKTVFDAIGREVSRTLPNYTPPGGSTSIVATTVYTYDEVGNLTQVSDPLNHLTTYVYTQQGDLAKVTAADGGVTHHVYDANGERLSSTGPTGAEVQATYDHLGRTLTTSELERYPSPTTSTTTNSYASSTSNPGGSWLASSTTQDGVVTRYGYNAAGETTSTTDGAGNVTSYRYDFLGRSNGTTAPDNTSTTVVFDQSGSPVAVTDKDAAGAVVRTTTATYDNVGNLLSATDGRGYTTTFVYDASGSLTQEVQPVTATTGITTSFGYDAAGNRTRFTDGRGNAWLTTYNTWNLPESVVEPATAAYPTAPDRTTTTAYDAAGRATSLTLPGGVSVAAGYDAVGNLTSQSGTGADAATATRTFGYDLAGQLTSAATAAAGGAAATVETFTYNDRGGLLTASDAGGASSFSYTRDGLMASRTDTSGTTSYTYDSANRLATLADAATGTTLTYGYNALSQFASVTHGAGGDVRTFGYDGLHRLTSDALKTSGGAAVASVTYGYDGNSNVTSKTTTGFIGAAANTYTYDRANRLVTWGNGTATVNYGYDASGNRTQVGANVYTYDARDQLTSDGTNTYTYSARGTMRTQTSTAGTVTSTSDAYGQTTSQGTATQGTQTYAYDALGRALKVAPTTGAATTFAYSGTGNTPSSDTNNTYTRDPDGALVGIATPGGGTASGVLAYVDTHTDVVGAFTATGSALSGSTAYDPLGQVLASTNQVGSLGYQSGWTDRRTGRVNMAARWYDPAVGQFDNKDTIAQNPVPNSAEANPFAYVNDNPMTGTDPSGHGWFSSLKNAATSAWNNVTSTVSSAYNAATSYVSSYASSAWNSFTSFVDTSVDWARNAYHTVVNTVKDVYQKAVTVVKQAYNAATNYVKKQVTNVVHAVATTYHAATNAVATAAHAVARVGDATIELASNAIDVTTTYVKNHAAAITSFVVSTVVFMGCEAVLGAVTAGVGAVAGAVACGALAGAVGGLVTQGFSCAKGEQGACSVGAFLQAGIVGGVVGGVAGLGGALGGKLLSAVGGKAMSAIGGLFGRGGAEAAEGGAADIAAGLSNRAGAGADNALTSGADDVARATPRTGGRPGTEEPGPGQGPRPGERPSGGRTCTPAGVHSFTGATTVLLAGGETKRIDQVKVGDTVTNAVPGTGATETHTVHQVIVTRTDHDFVDVTVAPATDGHASAPAAVWPRTGSTLTTTFHHPFYDRTQAAFVDAVDLRVGDELQSGDGTLVVTGVYRYHTTRVTYDLTVDGLHTFYVLAGNLPVLVHNYNCTPLTTDEKDVLRAEARDIWQATTGLRAAWRGMEVHHRIPLEWSHVMPGAPNRLANLVGMLKADHNLVSQAWAAWKRGLGGATPSSADIMRQALAIDRQFGHLMVFPK
jgi:RHS repeat-associated protein